MYDWLSDIPADRRVQVVTPTRRLARALRDAYSANQLAAGRSAWKSPAIFALPDWYAVLAEDFSAGSALPVRLNEQQARLLWEECLRLEMDAVAVNSATLARLCRDAWQRLHDWRVPLARVTASAATADQRLFARAAMRYAALQDERNWVDSAILPGYLAKAVAAGRLAAPDALWCSGFDRRSPQFVALLDALQGAGARCSDIAAPEPSGVRLLAFANRDAELRAAGAWARAEFARGPGRAIGIVVTHLEQEAGRSADLVREGLVSGWQVAGARVAAAVDLSYGSRLADLPAIHVALLSLRWLVQPLAAADIGLLLRSSFLGQADTSGRSRLDLRLRELPDRNWHVVPFCDAMERRVEAPDAGDWLTRLRRARGELAAAPPAQAPSRWAAAFESMLGFLNWPGEAPLSSEDFQLDNRWRQLLNEFARLELVMSRMSGGEAVMRLAGLAADTVFQPESTGSVVTVLGPLEAAGLEFDAVWLTGAVATDWPPSAHPSALLSRELQREYRMPDASPGDTAAFAGRVLRRIAGSAPECIASYPLLIGDAVQLPTRLLGPVEAEPGTGDPGWYARGFAGTADFNTPPDPAPPVRAGERVGGGAGVIGLQSNEPFAAFAIGRLRARELRAYTSGIAPNVRGNLVHAALAQLYDELPDRSALQAWTPPERLARIEAAVTSAYRREERYADEVLRELLALEKARTAALLAQVIETDTHRAPFRIAGVESSVDAVIGGLHLGLRCDRMDRLPDGSLVILDYKSGNPGRFMGRDGPNDLQLIVYSCIVDAPVSGLGLFVVDCKRLEIDAVGPAFAKAPDWEAELDRWRATVLRHAAELASGDVRLNARQGLTDARALSVLSRYPEVYRGD